ncbi:tol-pal system protein YbgF [Oxalobacter sp. OttesenSCG-928-P03]|nr:tol-pal system protein YbgF [Oxalobacter sp. OttesenSCG-928-P03]
MNKTPYFFLSLVIACMLPWQAKAALFEDADARRSILDLRAKVNEKADKDALLELSRQNETLKEEVARLRGQVEVLTNELKTLQQKQRDFYVDLDNRVGKFEPQQVTVDGKNAVIQPEEKQAFDKAEAAFQAGDYKEAVSAYNTFLRRFPKSGVAVLAQYGLGNSYYLLKDYKNALSAHAVLVKRYPESEKVPETMLTMASCHLGLKDLWAAKKTLNTIVEKYPESEAAAEAKQRLKQME